MGLKLRSLDGVSRGEEGLLRGAVLWQALRRYVGERKEGRVGW